MDETCGQHGKEYRMELKDSCSNDRIRAVVDRNAIRHNYKVIRELFPRQKIMSVLKADAYGHGITGIAAVCEEYTDQFAVATVEEGRRLREAGAKKPVLLLGPVPEGRIAEAAELGLTFSVGSLAYAMKIRSVLAAAGKSAACQLKVDTGFNRTGFRYRDPGKSLPGNNGGSCRSGVCTAPFSPSESEMAFQQMQMVFRFRELQVTGIYTHLPVPESDFPDDAEFTEFQLACFREAVRRLRLVGCEPGLVHAFSTGGAMTARSRGSEELFDMIRVGMMIYGQMDASTPGGDIGLIPALKWSANLISTEEIAEGETVGYGRMFTAEKPVLLGVVSAGYADGYRRNYQGLHVLCAGHRVPVIGRVCMDFLMIDLTDVPEAEPGMEVVLLGSQEDENGTVSEISASRVAAKTDSTCGEVTAAISGRVPRYYVN